jgi:hypothetical protein
MTTEDNTSGIRVSNWTLATGTKSGERTVYPAPPQVLVRNTEQAARS